MAATQWDLTVGDTRTMRLRDTTAVAELVITVTDEAASATLRVYDVTGPLDPDPASLNNTILRETKPAGQTLLGWYVAGRDDQALWSALADAVGASTGRRQQADTAADAAADAVTAVVAQVNVDALRAAVRRIVLAALDAAG